MASNPASVRFAELTDAHLTELLGEKHSEQSKIALSMMLVYYPTTVMLGMEHSRSTADAITCAISV